MIKRCLGNSQKNSKPAWSKEFSYITRKSLRISASRYLTIRLRARVVYEQIVNEVQPS